MITDITNVAQEFVKDHMLLDVVLMTMEAGLMLISMTVDLIFGIMKAKANGIATTSTGLKKTCDKTRKYFTPFIILVCIDFLGSVVMPVPVFSLLWSVYCILCEFMSVREKAWQKMELRKQERTMSIILENKDDIAKMMVELMAQSAERANGNESK